MLKLDVYKGNYKMNLFELVYCTIPANDNIQLDNVSHTEEIGRDLDSEELFNDMLSLF